MNPEVTGFFDEATGTISYIVACPQTRRCAVVDPVLDFDAKSGSTATRGADALLAGIRERRLEVEWILETHAHADHLSAAPHVQAHAGGRIAIGSRIREVQATFGPIFNLGPGFATDGSQFDHLFEDGERFEIGELEAEVLHTPGHTPACATYAIGDAAFVGDTLFMTDYGTARCDFPGGDARALYRSIRKILSRPAGSRLFLCHDYPPATRGPTWEVSVAAQRESNIHVHDGVTEDEYVRMRTERDATLSMPALLLPSVQVNIRAGRLPEPDDNGIAYLRLPVNAFR